ncbi:hypothetical protein FAI41_06235 [Acetobacteraceae bacterium]|nr:hypothetical protein FAI41_06235 [Acetobacteraceae bacterium]
MPQPTYLTLPVKDWESTNYPYGSPLWDQFWNDLQKEKRKGRDILPSHLHPRKKKTDKFYAWYFPGEHYSPDKAHIEGHQLFLEILKDDRIHLRMVHRQLGTSNDQPLSNQLIEKITLHLEEMLKFTDIKITLQNKTVGKKYHSFGTFGEDTEWRLCHPNGLLNFSATVHFLAEIRDFFEHFINSLKYLK